MSEVGLPSIAETEAAEWGAAVRARKRRDTDERLKRPGGARRIRSAETQPVTFDGVSVSDLPRPPDGT